MRGRSRPWTHGPRALIALAVVLALGLPTPVRAGAAEDARIAELQQRLDESLRLIADLSMRVRQLEQAKATDVAAAAPVTPARDANPNRLEAVEAKVAQIESASASRRADDSGLAMHGFADVGAGSRNPFDAELKGFNIGNLDFYLTPRLGDRTLTLFELVFEAGSDGSVSVDLERAQVGYVFGDHATAWLGRFHTPYGYTNTAMHHGAWVNDALRRPAFLGFEDHGGVMPAHTVGGWLTGSLRAADGGKLLYDAYLGNAQRIVGGELEMRSSGNAHGKLIYGGRLGYQWSGGSADGLTLGLHALAAAIDDDSLEPNLTDMRLYGGYAVYDTDRWEHVAEVYRFDNTDRSGGSGRHRSAAGFVQLGYRAEWGVPYVRHERAKLDQDDPYFRGQANGFSYQRSAIGVRYDLDLKSALKLEVARTHVTDRTISWVNEILGQYAIRF
jgi:hypothetical protein